MRHCIGLLALVILLACATASATVDSKRLLRTPTTTEVEDQEKAIIAPMMSRASKVAGTVWLRVWLLKKKTAADAFVKLKLDQGVDQALSSQ
ncbi:hypothetical protein PC128_g6573 [Phytophthora cactorum]|nr:hypothetical protein PC128_g6573 [Phytophthora cactorum]